MTERDRPSFAAGIEGCVRDRKRGAILGLAVGDALGAAVEFEPRGSFVPVSGYRAGGPHRLGPGAWTDDTSMALALAESIIETGWNLADQASRYLAWYRTGAYSVTGTCFDIGITTREALNRFERTNDARTSGPVHESFSGNGSIMRLAPVAVAYSRHWPDEPQMLVERAVESSLPTHGSPQCTSACAAMCAVMAALINGESRESVLAGGWHGWPKLKRHLALHPLIEEIASGSFATKDISEIRGSGHVVASLEAALWAFSRAESFEEAVLAAVNLGEDADTTGAVCGQIAGAYWGESGIPKSLLTGLARRDILDPILDRLVG